MFFGDITGFDCGGADVLSVIKFVFTLLDVVFFIVPIGLIIIISIDFAKSVIGNKEDEMKKNAMLALKRIIFCVALFCVEPVVQAAINLLDEGGVEYAECINIALNDDLSQYKIEYEEDYTTDEPNFNNSSNYSVSENDSTNGTHSTDSKYLYELKNPDSSYSGHTVNLTDNQYLSVCRALYGERSVASYEIYVALAQYIRDHVDAYEAVGTKAKNYDNIGSKWMFSASSTDGSNAASKDVAWFKDNRPEVIEAVDYVFSQGGSFAQGFLEFYVDKWDGSTPETASNNLISAGGNVTNAQNCYPYGGNYSNHENFTLTPEWGDTEHWFSCSICPWYRGVKSGETQRTSSS